MGIIKTDIEESTYNSISEQHIKEGISTGYVKAIAHYAGMNIEFSDMDYGFDGTFSGVKIREHAGKRRILSDGCKLDFQLKASINVEIKNDVVEYNLEAKNYNDLVDTEICTPRILILYKLPKDKESWIKVSTTETVFKDCAWWCYLSGQEETKNKEKKLIKIPKNQILDQNSLRELMKKVRRGELV
ncbi:MAG: DUF4365 domain-containing protein [Clostridium butyricum]|nr:DUF4365 domain-containing protein [Clostridium butyricum]